MQCPTLCFSKWAERDDSKSTKPADPRFKPKNPSRMLHIKSIESHSSPREPVGLTMVSTKCRKSGKTMSVSDAPALKVSAPPLRSRTSEKIASTLWLFCPRGNDHRAPTKLSKSFQVMPNLALHAERKATISWLAIPFCKQLWSQSIVVQDAGPRRRRNPWSDSKASGW